MQIVEMDMLVREDATGIILLPLGTTGACPVTGLPLYGCCGPLVFRKKIRMYLDSDAAV